MYFETNKRKDGWLALSCLKNSSDVILFEEKKSKVVKSVLF